MSTAFVTRKIVSATKSHPTPVQFGRVVTVEFRKFFHTTSLRCIMWVCLGLMAVVAVGLGLGYTTVFHDVETGQTIDAPWIAVATVIRLLLQLIFPALIVLPVASEWSTRSAITTFTLVPQRGKVVEAKALVAAVVAAVGYGLVAGTALLTTYLARLANGISLDGMWADWSEVGCELTVWFLTMASAFALALLLHNGGLSIALVIGVPIVLQILSQLGEMLMKVTEWLNLESSAAVAFQGDDASGIWKLIVAASVWVLLPLVLGTLRTLRRETA